MKRILSILAILVIVVAFSACNSKSGEASRSADSINVENDTVTLTVVDANDSTLGAVDSLKVAL